ncbi:hypothetical protein C8R45DRAFT_1101415 [Mycena sanguinolenta]|nr:hypothetical protein C8R45DRAFT_1101415 [Mycena sanguinolenta]
MAPIAQELVDIIVGLVPDNNSLIACALTAKSFVTASQRRLLHSVTISKLHTLQCLAAALTKSPDLGPYVRNFTFDVGRNISGYCSALVSVLKRATRMERLTIKGAPSGTNRWFCFGPDFVEFLEFSPLRCVALANLSHVPSSIVTMLLETFEEVSLLDIDIDLEHDESYDDDCTPLTDYWLQRLNLSHQKDTILSFLSQPRQRDRLECLTHLSMSFSDPPTSIRERFLAMCGPTLETLELEFSHPFALPTLPFLEQLELRFDAEKAIFRDALSSSLTLALKAAPHLKKLTVAIREQRAKNDHRFDWGILARIRAPGWPALDQRLLQMHAPSAGTPPAKLTAVHFALTYSREELKRYATFVADVMAQLPDVYKVGFLTFSYRASFVPSILRFSQDQHR